MFFLWGKTRFRFIGKSMSHEKFFMGKFLSAYSELLFFTLIKKEDRIMERYLKMDRSGREILDSRGNPTVDKKRR